MHATNREILATPFIRFLFDLDVGRSRVLNQANRVDIVKSRVDMLSLIHVRYSALPVFRNRLDPAVLVTLIVKLIIGEILNNCHVFVLFAGEASLFLGSIFSFILFVFTYSV